MGGIAVKILKFMDLYLTVCRREQHTSNFVTETILVQKEVYIQTNFVFSNNALQHQLVTMQGKVLKI